MRDMRWQARVYSETGECNVDMYDMAQREDEKIEAHSEAYRHPSYLSSHATQSNVLPRTRANEAVQDELMVHGVPVSGWFIALTLPTRLNNVVQQV